MNNRKPSKKSVLIKRRQNSTLRDQSERSLLRALVLKHLMESPRNPVWGTSSRSRFPLLQLWLALHPILPSARSGRSAPTSTRKSAPSKKKVSWFLGNRKSSGRKSR